MKKGGGGKFWSFLIGLVLGIILVPATIAGVVYYFATVTTVGEIQDLAKVDVIEKDSEISQKTVADIYKMMAGIDFKTMTVQDARDTFGLDVVAIAEKALGLEMIEGPEKQTLYETAIVEIPNNLEVLLNCFSLKQVTEKFGLELPDYPLINDNIEEPIVQGLNAIMASFDFDNLTLADLEYKLGIKLDAEVLQNVKNTPVNELGGAIESLALEKVLPNFDRDFYFENGAQLFVKTEGYSVMEFAQIGYILIESGDSVEPSERYAYNEADGTYTADENGAYQKEVVANSDRYSRTDEGVYYQDRNGGYKVSDGTLPAERYNLEGENYVASSKGIYKYQITYTPATGSEDGGTELYAAKYVAKIIDADGTYTLEQRGYAPVNSENEYRYQNGAFERYAESDDAWVTERYTIAETDDGAEVTAADDGKYVLVHIGATEKLLKALADTTLSTLNDKLGTLTVYDIMEVDGDEYRPLTVQESADAAFIAANKNELFVNINGLYYHYDATNTEHAGKDIYLRTYIGTTHAALKQLANVPVLELGNRMTEVIDSLVIRDVMTVYDDYTVVENGEYINIGTTEAPEFIKYADATPAQQAAATQRYAQPSHIVVRKIANIALSELGTKLQSVVDDIELGELVTVVPEDTWVLLTSENESAYPEADYKRYMILENNGQNYFVLHDGGVSDKWIKSAEKSNAVLIKLSTKKVGELSSGLDGIIDDIALDEVINIDNDLFDYATQQQLDENTANGTDNIFIRARRDDGSVIYVVYNGENSDNYYGVYTAEQIAATPALAAQAFYFRFYEGGDHTVMKMLSHIQIKNINTVFDTIIDELSIGDVVDVRENTYYTTEGTADMIYVPAALFAADDGEYVIIGGAEVLYDENNAAHSGLARYTMQFAAVQNNSGDYIPDTADGKTIYRKFDASDISGGGTLVRYSRLYVEDVLMQDNVNGTYGVSDKGLKLASDGGDKFVLNRGAVFTRTDTDGNLEVYAGETGIRLYTDGDGKTYESSGKMMIELAKRRTKIGNMEKEIRTFKLSTIINADPDSILGSPKLADATLDTVGNKMGEVLATATLRELNAWGNMGLNVAVIAMAGDVTAKEFFTNLQIGVDPTTGDPILYYKVS